MSLRFREGETVTLLPGRMRLLGPAPELGPGAYRVYDRSLLRPRVVRLLQPAILREEALEPLQSAWQGCLGMDHPGLLRLLDTEPSREETAGERAFLVFEDFQAVALGRFLRTLPRTPERSRGEGIHSVRLEIAWQAASALGFLHERGQGHGAFAPERILIEDREGYPWMRLSDWVPDSPRRLARLRKPERDIGGLERLFGLLSDRATGESEQTAEALFAVQELLRSRKISDPRAVLERLEKTAPVPSGSARLEKLRERLEALAPSREALLREVAGSLDALGRVELRRGRVPPDLPAEGIPAVFLLEGASGTGKSFLLEKAKQRALELGIEVRALAVRESVQDYVARVKEENPKRFYVLEEAERWSPKEWTMLQEIFPSLLTGWPKAVLAIAYRPAELQVAPRALFGPWAENQKIRRLELGSFHPGEMGALVGEAFETLEGRRALEETLSRSARGSPRQSVGLLAEWIEKGVLSEERPGSWSFESAAIGQVVDRTVTDWARRRYRESSYEEQKTLRTLAALRVPAPASWLARLLPASLETARRILNDLAAKGLLLAVAGGRERPVRYRIAIPELEEELRKAPHGGPRAEWRGAILEEEYATRPLRERAELVEPLASNYLERAAPRKAWVWGLRAIRESIRSGSFQRALRVGEALLDRIPRGLGSLKEKLARQMLQAASEAGLAAEAETWLARLTELRGEEPTAELLSLCEKISAHCIGKTKFREAIRWARRGLSAAGSDPDRTATFLYTEAFAQSGRGESKKANELALRALGISGQTPLVKSRILHFLGATAFNRSNYPAAISFLEERQEILGALPRRRRSLAEQVKLCHDLAVSYRKVGDSARAHEALEKGLRLCAGLRDPVQWNRLRQAQATQLQSEGQLQRARRFYERCLEDARQLADPQWMRMATENLATTQRYLGNLSDAERLHREALALAREATARGKVALSTLGIARTLLEQGRWKESQSTVLEAEELYRKLEDQEGLADCHLLEADLAARRKDIAKAGENLAAADTIACRKKLRSLFGNICRIKAEILARQGLGREALGWIEEAARWFDLEPARYEACEARLRACEFLFAAGRAARATQDLRKLSSPLRVLGSSLLRCRRALLLGEVRPDPERRVRSLEKAIELAVRCGARLLEARARKLLGEELLRLGREAERAKEELARAKEIFRDLDGPSSSSEGKADGN